MNNDIQSCHNDIIIYALPNHNYGSHNLFGSDDLFWKNMS